MFDSLSDRLGATLDGLRGQGRLTEDDINRAMREIRLALLEADVNFGVVREFVAAVKERALGADVMQSLTPGQQVIKIVHEELTSLMGTAGSGLSFASRPPTVILMAGLQGSGKTTACGKLALLLTKQKRSPAMVACDLQRPAAVQQLQTLGRSIQVPVFDQGVDADPVEVAAWGVEQARAQGRDVVIVDTAGRLHVDEELMGQLVEIKKAVKPHNVLLVLDAMTGQDAVSVAERFSEAVDYDGVDPDEARRRRPRRRRPAGPVGHREADQVRLGGREARPARAVPPRPPGVAHPRDGRRDVAHRAGAGADLREATRRRWRPSSASPSSRSTTSSTSSARCAR